jgi:hypothetical protein
VYDQDVDKCKCRHLEVNAEVSTALDAQQLPQSPITAADLAGRAYRIARLNWRFLLGLFIVPTFYYAFSEFSAVWIAEHAYFGVTTVIVVAAASLMLLVVSRCLIYEVTYAVLLVLNGHAGGVDSARKEASKKRPLLLLLISPVVLADAALMIVSAVSSWLMETGRHHEMQQLLALLLLVAQLLASFPVEWLTLLCGLFIATLIAEKLTVAACCKRIAYFLRRAFGYFSAYVALFAVMYFALSIPTGILAFLYPLAGLFTGTAKEFATASLMLLQCCLMTPLYALMLAASAVGSAALHGQLTMHLECRDLIQRLSPPIVHPAA